MSIHFSINAFVQWLIGSKNREHQHLMNQLRYLVSKGLETEAEVLQVYVVHTQVGKLFPVDLSLKIKRNDDTVMYIQSKTLLGLNQIPSKGQMLRIKYFPENLHSILVLGN